MDTLLTVAGVVVAACVATFGYLYTQANNDRERMARTFAEALSAVQAFRFVPFQVRRRGADDIAVRKELTTLVTAAQDQLDFNAVLLQLEDPAVADAYVDLVKVARQEVNPLTKDAWEAEPVTSDSGLNMSLGAVYATPRTADAIGGCIALMRHRISKRTWRRQR